MKARDEHRHGAARCMIADPIVLIEDDHQLQLQLCDILEHLADGLPDNVEAHLARVAACAVQSAWPKHIQFEEDALIPLISARVAHMPEVSSALGQLSREHASDFGSDDEVLEALRELSLGRRPTNPEMVGYLLRGYFETLRRHVSWEDVFLVPLARRVLMPEDTEKLRGWVIDHGRATCARDGLRVARGSAAGLCMSCLESEGTRRR